jgi:hypothetical protein
MTLFLGMLIAASFFVGCGGGGSADNFQGQALPPSGPAALLSWTPPETTADNTVIDPYQELDYYEIYVRDDENFTDTDLPVAQVAAVEDLRSTEGQAVAKSLVTEFALDLLPNVPAANRLYVSLKAVGIDRQRSAFMAPVAWDRL